MNSNPKFNKKVQSITSDLRIVRQVTKPAFQERICPPRNLNQLSNLLKKKNMNILTSREEKQKGQQWLADKGVDVSPLVQKLRFAKQQTTKQQVMKKKEEDCYFYIAQINQTKEVEYLNKAVQFSTLGLLQKTMSSRQFRKDFTRRMINKMRGIDSSGQFSSRKQELGKITNISTQFRSQSKKNQYIKSVEKMIKNKMKESKMQEDWLAEQLSNTIQSKVWRILNAHIQAVSQGKSQSYNIMEMLIESLRMVQKQYDQKLSTNNQSINNYLNNNYLQKMNHQEFVRDNQHGSFYGKLFILYRAGRKAEFYNLLSSRNQFTLIDQFHKAQISINKKEPITFDHKSHIKDVFLDQLIYSLRGQAKYSSQFLSNPNNLDFIWIVLRNIGIFYEKNAGSFENVKQMIIENYKSQAMTSSHILNLMYVLAYNQIVKIGVNQIMDQDDYLHFLLCVSSNPILMSNAQDQNLAQQKLSEQLTTYIYELISLGRSQYLYYMSLFPRKHIVAELSSIISASQLIKVVNWDFFKSNLPLQIFNRLVAQTLEKYMKSTSDYIMVAQKYSQLLNDRQKSVKTLLQMLVKATNSIGFSQYAVKNAEDLIQKMLMFDKNLQEKYERTIKLLIQNRKLVELIAQRNDHKLYQMVTTTDFIILDGIVRQKNRIMFDNLISLHGFQVYFMYMRHITRAVEICMLRRNQNKQLKDFYDKLYTSLKQILKLQRYNRYSNKDIVVNVMSTLKQSLYEVQSYNS